MGDVRYLSSIYWRRWTAFGWWNPWEFCAFSVRTTIKSFTWELHFIRFVVWPERAHLTGSTQLNSSLVQYHAFKQCTVLHLVGVWSELMTKMNPRTTFTNCGRLNLSSWANSHQSPTTIRKVNLSSLPLWLCTVQERPSHCVISSKQVFPAIPSRWWRGGRCGRWEWKTMTSRMISCRCPQKEMNWRRNSSGHWISRRRGRFLQKDYAFRGIGVSH